MLSNRSNRKLVKSGLFMKWGRLMKKQRQQKAKSLKNVTIAATPPRRNHGSKP
jgi:hypothetical protein